MRPHYQTILKTLNLIDELAQFEPTVIGTPPLEIDLESSDIDVACTAKDFRAFELEVTNRFDYLSGFLTESINELPGPALRVEFHEQGWNVELFCQSLPIHKQWGVRHFLVEKRLLQLAPALKPEVIKLKRSGLKTEPAFATVLNLNGDPFEAVLRLESYSDRELALLVQANLVQR